MKVCKRIVSQWSPSFKLVVVMIERKVGYVFNMCTISKYQIHFLIRHFLGTCIPWPSSNSKSCSITTSFQRLNLTHRIWENTFKQIYSIFQVKNVQIIPFFFLNRTRIYSSKRYIVSKCLLIAAEVCVSFRFVHLWTIIPVKIFFVTSWINWLIFDS